MKPKRPTTQVCQLCAIDDFVTLESIGPDLWEFRCAGGPEHADRTHVWSPTASVPFEAGRTGIGEELGVYEDLLQCVHRGEWVEYGVVEHRFALTAPDTYAELVRRYGHASLGPTKYSASSFLSHALGQLYREGVLGRQNAEATGYWRYLRVVPYYSQPGAAALDVTTRWAAFATSQGIDPDTWPSTAPSE